MKLLRPVSLFALTLGLIVGFCDPSVEAAQQLTKQEKKEKRQKALAAKIAAEEAKKPAPAAPEAAPVPAKPVAPLGPIGPKDASLVAKMIDEAIAKKLADAKIPASPLCTDEEFVRRAYLDLTGVIPHSDKARAFIESSDPQKRAKLIDELLESPNYGRHLSDMWQTKLMPRDTNSRFLVRQPLVTWLEEQFNKNTPWNQFVSNLVSASGTVEENPGGNVLPGQPLGGQAHRRRHTELPRRAAPVCPVPQPPVHGLEADRVLGHGRVLLEGAAGRAEEPQERRRTTSRSACVEGADRSRGKDFFPESAKKVAPKFLGGEQPQLRPNEPYRPAAGPAG